MKEKDIKLVPKFFLIFFFSLYKASFIAYKIAKKKKKNQKVVVNGHLIVGEEPRELRGSKYPPTPPPKVLHIFIMLSSAPKVRIEKKHFLSNHTPDM